MFYVILTDQCEELRLYVSVNLVVHCRVLFSFKIQPRGTQLFLFMSPADRRWLKSA